MSVSPGPLESTQLFRSPLLAPEGPSWLNEMSSHVSIDPVSGDASCLAWSGFALRIGDNTVLEERR